jgi:hypothetical protein
MKKAFIHIGSGKTGSTAIQKALAAYESSDHNCSIYPVIENTGHQNIDILFKDENRVNRGLKSSFVSGRRKYDKYKNWFQQKMNSSLSDARNIVISSEFLFGFSRSEIALFKEYLDSFGFEECCVFCYVRDYVSYYLSFLQQQVKASGSWLLPADFRPNYCKIMDNWASAFGDSEVHVVEFKLSSFPGQNVVSDFEDRLRSFFGLCLSLPNKDFINETLSVEQIVLLCKYRNMFLPESHGLFNHKSNKLLKCFYATNAIHPPKKPIIAKSAERIINHLNFQDKFCMHARFNVFGDVGAFTLDPFSSDATDVDYSNPEDIFSNFNESDYSTLMLEVVDFFCAI